MNRTRPSTAFALLVALCGMACPEWAIAQDCAPQRIEPPAGTPPEKFGYTVATNGRFWFIGDRAARTRCGGSTFSCSTGAVHVYELFDGQLEFTQTIVPPDIVLGANFGYGMAVDGDRLVVGAPWQISPGGMTLPGLVFEYAFDGASWQESGRLEPPPPVLEGFGKQIVLDGDSMIVWNQVTRPDAVYVYRNVGESWSLVQTLSPGPDAISWEFGARMILDEQWLFVAAPDDDSIAPRGGSVFIYTRQPDGTFEFFQKIAADFPSGFGTDIAYDGGSLLVGVIAYAPEFQTQGGVFSYDFDGNEWVLKQRVTLREPRRNDGLGRRVSVEGRTMLTMARGRRTPEGTQAVFQFEQNSDGTWREVRRLVPTPLGLTGTFGFEMVINNGLALIASLDEVTASGAGDGTAYFFDLACRECEPDLDLDGTLTVFDLLTFLNLFQDGDPAADFDGDGELTVFDFLAFQTAFDAGCE
jgi:hypothetical protein